MKKTSKIISILLLVSLVLSVLGGCGNSTSGNKKSDAEEAAKAYIGAYLNEDNDKEKEEISDLVLKRDYHVVNLYSRQDGRDNEILQAYYEALKKVEYTVKSSSSDKDGAKATVAIKGIDISGIEKEVTSFAAMKRREQKMPRAELYKVMEDKAVEELKNVKVRDESEVELKFEKGSDGKLKLSDESIATLENTLSFMQDEYIIFTGDVPDEFKALEK